jgi:predicted  nucleic acid-binding Zn-ribbon protein
MITLIARKSWEAGNFATRSFVSFAWQKGPPLAIGLVVIGLVGAFFHHHKNLSRINYLTKSIKSLNSSLSDKERRIGRLSSELSSEQTSARIRLEKINDLARYNTELKRDIEELSSRLQANDGELQAYFQKVKNLRERNTELETKVARLETEKDQPAVGRALGEARLKPSEGPNSILDTVCPLAEELRKEIDWKTLVLGESSQDDVVSYISLSAQRQFVLSDFKKALSITEKKNSLRDKIPDEILDDLSTKIQDLIGRVKKNYVKTHCERFVKDTEVEDLFKELRKKGEAAHKLEKSINRLISKAVLPKELKPHYEVRIKWVETKKTYEVSLANPDTVSMGYTLFSLMKTLGLKAEDSKWEGEISFSLNSKDFDGLSKNLGQIDHWLTIFEAQISGLIGSDQAESCIQLGQKSAKETFDSSQAHMTQEGLVKISKLSKDHPCLILAVSLDLKEHPDQGALKKGMEEIFAAEEMISMNGKAKTFIEGTYRANLNTKQMEQITPRLNRWIAYFRRIVTENEPRKQVEAKKHPTLANPEEIQSFYIEKINKFNVYLLEEEDQTVQMPGVGRYNTIQSYMTACRDVFEKNQDARLRTHTVVGFKPRTPPYYVDTPERRAMLYGTNPQYHNYGSVQGTFYNQKELFDKLKKNKHVIAAAEKMLSEHDQAAQEDPPDLLKKLDDLCNLIERMIRYKYPEMREKGPYGKGYFREAIGVFERYVARILDIENSKVTVDSIEYSLMELIALDFSELEEYCTEGLKGRILQLLGCLRVEGGEPFDDFICRVQNETLNTVFNRQAAQDAQSSHNRANLVQAEGYLFHNQESYEEFSELTRGYITNFLKEYTPEVVHREALSYFKDRLLKLTLEENTEETQKEITGLLKMLSIPVDEQSERYYIDGDKEKGWQYATIEEDLETHLIGFLLTDGYLGTREYTKEVTNLDGKKESTYIFDQGTFFYYDHKPKSTRI